jgi:hypothetical protein
MIIYSIYRDHTLREPTWVLKLELVGTNEYYKVAFAGQPTEKDAAEWIERVGPQMELNAWRKHFGILAAIEENL